MAVVVRARAANMDPQLEEAARDLGASAWGAFRFVTLPLLRAGDRRRARCSTFALSFDDLIITTFNAGVGSSTLPLYIYSKIRFGVTPEINAISTIIVAVTAVAGPDRLAAGRAARRRSGAAAAGDLTPGSAPSGAGGGALAWRSSLPTRRCRCAVRAVSWCGSSWAAAVS